MSLPAGIADREVALVAACCRWPRDPEAVAETARLLAGSVDSARLLRITRRHRVEALVCEALRYQRDRLDGHDVEALLSEAEAVRHASLQLAAESLRLHRVLSDARVRHLFVKGEGLAQIAYGQLGLKAARDLDILHAPEDFDRVAGVMTAAGYDQLAPPPRLTAADRRLWVKLQKDSVWRHPGTGLVAELHHRLTLSSALLPGIIAASPAISVELARGQSLPLLNLTDHYIYLCVHGALSGWSRLKWLVDLNALLNAPGAPPVPALHAAAERQGVAGASHLAHLLMERLFGRPREIELTKNPEAVRAADRVVDAMTGQNADREPRNGGLADLRRQSAIRKLVTVPHQRWAMVPLLVTSFGDRAALRLPRPLTPFYWLIRLPSIGVRKLFGRTL